MTIQAITPVRILDTRPTKITNGQPGAGPLNAGDTRTLQVLGKGAVPLSGVAAIVGNVTVLPGTSSGYLTIWPAGYQMPTASNVNYPATPAGQPVQPIANQFICGLGPGGAIALYDGFGAGLHVVIDIQGWIAATELDAVGPSVPVSAPFSASADTIKAGQILTNATGYAMTTWWPGPAQTLLASDLGVNAHDAVRRLAMAALGLSTAYATGLSTDPVMLARAIALVDRVATSHVTNTAGGWGESAPPLHQTPMWAAICARAAWFIWPQLPAATRAAVARMVEHEADYAARRQIHYLRDASGTILTPGDSGCEEVSWWGLALQVAQVMLPTHPHVRIWATEMERFALAAAARPQDVAGLPQITGSNVEASGEVVNHSRLASDYATCLLYQLMDAYPLFTLAGRSTPQAMRQLSGPAYGAFTTAAQPTYPPNSAAIFYPQGCDWGTGQVLPYALADAQALAYGYDPGTAGQYLGLHLDAVLAQQARHADGHTYASDAEYNYEGREEHTLQLAGQLWMTRYLHERGLGSFG